jgi:hypothetical protein
MKISEILVENEYERGKDFGTRLVSPSQWFRPKTGGQYQKGKDLGSKILSPSQWFKSNKSSEVDVDSSKEKSKPVEPTFNLSNVKKILNSIVLGEPRYPEDMKVISQLRSKIKNGSIDVSVKSDDLNLALKSVIGNIQLSSDQIKLIKAYADSI